MAMHSAAMPLPTEATVTIVSRDHGVVRAQFECPAQRSTTNEPSTITDTADPTSGGPPPGRASNNDAYASCTGLNARSHVPEISTVMSFAQDRPADRPPGSQTAMGFGGATPERERSCRQL